MRISGDASDTFCTASGNSLPIHTTNILEAAIDLARRFRVVPLNPGLKSPWLEYCTTGYKDRPAPTEYEIRDWFDVNPNLNIGIHMGHGLIALDVDEKPGKMSGSEALARLEELHGPLSLTLTSITGSGGQHRIFRLPPGYDFGDSLPVVKAWLKANNLPSGVIDVKGTGLIAAPPSIHPSGPRYRWEDPDAEIATLPIAWCETPEPLTLEDPERRTRLGKQGPSLHPKDSSDLDRATHERIADVDEKALLGKETLLLLANGDPEDPDRTHVMGRAILGAASVRFDPDAFYIRMLNSPLEDGLRDHGRAWFDREFFCQHRYLVGQVFIVREIRADIEEYEWTPTEFMGKERREFKVKAGQGEWTTKAGRTYRASPKAMKKVLHASLDIAEEFATTEPILDKTKIARITGLSKMTVWVAFQGLIALGWLEVVPEEDRNSDDPYTYRLFPGAQRTIALTHEIVCVLPLGAGSLESDEVQTPPSSLTVSRSTTVEVSRDCPDESDQVAYQSPSTSLTVGRGIKTEMGKDYSDESDDLFRGRADVLMPPGLVIGSGDRPMLQDFSDPDVPSEGRYWYEPPEPPGSDWTQHRCRKCGERTISVRDAESRRPFRMDAEPSEYGTLVVVNEDWKLPQVATVAGRVAVKQYTRHYDTCGRVAEGPEVVPSLPEPRKPMTAIPEPRPPMSEEELQASKDRLVARIKGANPQAYTPGFG